MKQFIAATIVFLSVHGYSQTSVNVQPNSAAALNQYIWSYAKNNAKQGEKPLIDFEVMDNWRGLGRYLAVSNDANYFSYSIDKPTEPEFWHREMDSLVVQSTRTGWRVAFAGANPGFFTANDETYVFQNGETLCFLQLGKSQITTVKDVVSYKVTRSGKSEWLSYLLKDSNVILRNLVTGKEKSFPDVTTYSYDNSGNLLVCKRANDLILYNLGTGTELHVPFVEEYTFANNGKAVLLKAVEKKENGVETSLKYLAAPDWSERTIWSTDHEKVVIASYSLDNKGRQVLFIVKDSIAPSIWYYNAGMDKAIEKLTNTTAGIAKGLTITDVATFTDNGNYIRFSLQQSSEVQQDNPEMAHVEVWGNKDIYLQSAQAKSSKQPKVYTALINIENGKLLPLESNGKKLYLLQGDFALVKKDPMDEHGDRFWEVSNDRNSDSNWIVSLKDGSSKLLPTAAGRENFWFSPGGKYLLYFDVNKGYHYFSYHLTTGELKDLTVNVSGNQLALSMHYKDSKIEFGSLAAWLENDAGVLVYDDYDIWKLDLTGKKPASNVTNRYGNANGIMFNMPTNSRFNGEIPVLKINASLLLRAFNTRNKESGFFQAGLSAGDLKRLYMGSYFMNVIYGCHDPNLSNDGMAPVKAKGQETWIVQRQSAIDAPNYFETSDFKSFRRLTDFQPQKKYQWLTEELVSFKHLDGRLGQGILYKPENFDPKKQYPVLIAFYGAFSNNLNQFHMPGYIDQAMQTGKSPVWFVNNGYLVFTPDIYTTPLRYGQSAFSVIEGAVQYLKQFPYVNGNKIGYASHSWSAKLGTYLLTHSTSFSATAISEGFIYANPINMALSSRNGLSTLRDVEKEMEYGNFYENKEAWLDQTAVLQADKAKTPLLLFCNKESSPEYQNQTLQFFTALRRLEKNCWWLSYENGSHTLQNLKELRDYTIRYTQFFDHYLKNAPAPMWMTQGLPYRLKGIESRYELDPQGTCNSANGERCLICQAWNDQYKKTPQVFQKEVKDWMLNKDIAEDLERNQKERRKELNKESEIQTREVLKMLNAGK